MVDVDVGDETGVVEDKEVMDCPSIFIDRILYERRRLLRFVHPTVQSLIHILAGSLITRHHSLRYLGTQAMLRRGR